MWAIILTYVFQIRNEVANTWLEAFVDATSGKLVSVTDLVSRLGFSSLIMGTLKLERYSVLPIEKQLPDTNYLS